MILGGRIWGCFYTPWNEVENGSCVSSPQLNTWGITTTPASLPNILYSSFLPYQWRVDSVVDLKFPNKKEFNFPSYPFEWRWLIWDSLAIEIQVEFY